LDSRTPPQNLSAEQSVLGGVMLEPDSWHEVADVLTENDFYKPSHRIVFSAIRDLGRKGQPVDILTVSNFLLSTKQLEAAGGAPYLAELIDSTPTTVNIKSHARIVKDKSTLRSLIGIGQKFVDRAYGMDFEDLDGFLNEFESSVFKLAETKGGSDVSDSSELVKLSLEKIETLFARKGDVIGIPSGFIELDRLTAGFQPKELIIIAARPSMGKTAFSLNIATHAALREQKTVAYFSVEMAKEQVMLRMLASEARINMGGLRTGQISDSDWPRLINAAAKMSEAPLFIDDTSGLSPFELHAKARRIKAKRGLDLIIVDYLQLMSLKQKVESREREVSEISKMLKAIAKDLGVPVIALAQLNRGVEGRSDRRPMLSDLRESGSIEQDADVIMMLYREDYYDRDNSELRGLAEVIIGKQRNGPTDAVKVRWMAEYGLFANNSEDRGPKSPMPSGGDRPNVTPFNGPTNSKPRNFAPQF
jgi:replicative DNA helicase